MDEFSFYKPKPGKGKKAGKDAKSRWAMLGKDTALREMLFEQENDGELDSLFDQVSQDHLHLHLPVPT